MQDWSGNKQSIFTTLGASNHVDHERAEYDYYATEPMLKYGNRVTEVDGIRFDSKKEAARLLHRY